MAKLIQLKDKDGYVYPVTKSSTVVSSQTGASQSNLVSVKNINFEELPGIAVPFTSTKDKSTILAFVSVGGLYNDNTGYGIFFDVQMDNSIKSTSGTKSINNGDCRNNWATNGTSKVVFFNVFVFTNVSKGNHTFKILWKSNNNDVTAYTGNYSNRSMTIVEI